MVLCHGGEEVGRGQLLAAGGKVQPVAEGRLLRHGDDRCFTGLALDALLASLAGVALLTLLTLRAGVAFGALDALLPDGTLFAHRAPFPLFAPLAPGTDGPLGAGIALGTGRPPVSLGPDGTGIAPDPLQSHAAGVALGTGIPPHALGAPRAHRPHRAPGTGGTGAALLSLDAPGSHGTLLAPDALLAPGTLRPCGACGALDGHIGAAGVRLAAAAPAGPGIVIHSSLPLMKIMDRCPVVCPGRGGGA